MKKEKSIKDRLIMKYLTVEHLGQFNDLLRYAFQVTDNELSSIGWEVEEIRDAKSPILDMAKVLGWFDGDKLASQVAVYPMKINIYGQIYDMGGITGVATYPEYANLGLMSDLLLEIIKDMKENRQCISFLYPYSIPFYRRKGWEIVSDKMNFMVKDVQLPNHIPVPGMVERVPCDHKDLRTLHNRFTSTRHGTLIRDELAWEEYWRWEVDDITVAVYYDKRHRPQGYVVYLLENEIFRIKELVYLNQEARHGIWNYISAHFSMVTEVRGANYTNEPIAFLLEDSEIEEQIQPYIMARITDVCGFMEAYPFRSPKKDRALHFVIDDPMVKWNRGDFTVTWDDSGKTICRPGLKEGERIRLSIQTLTTMMMGYKRPSYLQKIERIKANVETIRYLESLIGVEQPYFSDYF